MVEDAAGSTTSGSPSPASGQGNGYQNPGQQAPAAPSPTGQSQTGDTDAEEIKDPGALLRSYRALQAAEKTQRNRLAQLEAAAKRDADAKLSEQERLAARVAELETDRQARERQTQERILAYEIKLQAAALSLVDPDAAVKLLDWSQVEYDASGAPTNLDKALRDLVKDKPYLVSPAAGPQGASGPPATPASPTNPATRSTSAGATRRYSQADLADRDTYVKNRDDIVRAYREGRIDS